MDIGGVHIPTPLALAPMAGVTDLAFRTICRQAGAGYTCTEMVSAKALCFQDRKTRQIMELGEGEHPAAVQIFGSDVDCMARAAEKVARQANPDVIDINMGCPVPKVAGNGAGSALMKDPAKCAAIVAAVKRNTDLPVTVKIRAGWDKEHKNAVEVAKACEEAGAAAIAVHGRTRDQMYMGRADWDIIRQVKQAVQVPVIGNGDVVDAQSACQLLDATGCDMVLVGRGAMGNPWVFRQINAYLRDSCTILPPPGIAERIVVIRRHMDALCVLKGEQRAMREARKHVGWYLHGVRGAAQFRRRAGELSTLEDLDRLLGDVYAAAQQERDTMEKECLV